VPERAVVWVGSVAIAATFAVSAFAANFQLEHARNLYQEGEFRAELAALQDVAQPDAGTLLLRGQCHYMMGDAKAASLSLEKAVALEPNNSRSRLWLGRAYGHRAETSNFLLAPRLAIKARQSFEMALQLDAGNLEAINDLFEYCLDAPGLLGGGVDKAAVFANRVRYLDPAEYQYDQARLAERRQEYQVAESHYRRAAELAPNDPGRLADLASFLASRGKHQESDRVFERAREIAPGSRMVKIFMRRGCSTGVSRQGVLDSGCHVADRAQAELGRGKAARCSCLDGCVLRDNALGTG
jgi:tetratricopeptide (TPR) repeat protein